MRSNIRRRTAGLATAAMVTLAMAVGVSPAHASTPLWVIEVNNTNSGGYPLVAGVDSESTYNGAEVNSEQITAGSDNYAHQQWIFTQVGGSTSAPVWHIKNYHSGKYLAVRSCNTNGDTIQWSQESDGSQEWISTAAPGGGVYIKNACTKQYLTVDSSGDPMHVHNLGWKNAAGVGFQVFTFAQVA